MIENDSPIFEAPKFMVVYSYPYSFLIKDKKIVIVLLFEYKEEGIIFASCIAQSLQTHALTHTRKYLILLIL